MRRPRTATVILLLGALATGCGAPEGDDPATLYDRGMAALDAGQTAQAERHFAAMVEADPTDPVARAGLARAMARQGRFGEAIVQDKLALALDPRLPEVAYNVACSYAALGDTEASLRWLSRAWDGGIRDLNLIEQDPDLEPLRSDHRFAFFLATGALSLAEREAYVQVTPASAVVGEEIEVQLMVISLNRPLLAAPEQLELSFEGRLEPGTLVPRARVERFAADEIGGREYFQRDVRLTFEAGRAIEAMLGPFDVTLDGEAVPTRPAWLSVRDVLPGLRAYEESRRPDDAPAEPAAAPWFVSPGTVTDGWRHPFARWDLDGDERDLVVGVELETDGLTEPGDLELIVGDGRCGAWSFPRRTVFLRTRAEGASRVWFHLREGRDEARPARPCPDPIPLRVVRGDEVLFEGELAR